MKICVAQTRPVKGDIETNIENHKKIIEIAVNNKAGIIIFPELSLTGYEPELAEALAIVPGDNRLDDFQQISDANQVTIGVGMPTKNDAGICISMIIFQPQQAREIYSKKYLHADEEPYFISGQNFTVLPGTKPSIALAICYELSIPEHSENAYKSGAAIYIASVAKTADGVIKASNNLSAIASKYSITVLMCNCVGHCDNFESAGTSSIWNDKGILIGQLDNSHEGIIMIDTHTQEIIKEVI